MGEAPRDNLTASQANSAYFSHTDGYDPLVYENTPDNWFKIIGMMILFYIFQGFHWWANFELGIHNSTTSTYYNLIIFASAVFVIAIMLILGARVNKQKLTHEFYMEKISEENQRQRDEREKKQNKEAQAAKTAM